MPNGADGTSDLTVSSAAQALLSIIPDDGDTDGTEEPTPQAEPAVEGDEAPAEPDNEADGEPEVEPDNESEPDETTDEEPSQPPRTFRVKADGEEIEVTEDELLKGYSRTADYTRKTQKLAEERKAFEAEYQETRAVRERYVSNLKQVEQLIESATPKEPNWNELRQTLDPAEYAATVADWQLNQRRLEAVRMEREEAEMRAAEDAFKAHQARLAEERKALESAVPEWSKPDVAQREMAELLAYGEALGFQKQELAQVTDHRVVLMLRKAKLYDQAQAKAKTIAKPAAPAPKPAAAAPAPAQPVIQPAKPGPAPAVVPKAEKQRQEQMRKLRASGRVEDAAALLKDFI